MKIKYYIIVLFIFFSSCEYKPVFYSENIKFSIVKFETDGNQKINKNIKKNIIKLGNHPNPNKRFKIKIKSNKSKKVTSKDSSGDPQSYKLSVIVNFQIEDENGEIELGEINKNREYVTNENKFDLKNYEQTIEDNLTIQIANEIILSLYSFKK